ncbi:MAG TPA: hypothetical protein PJ998_04700 [Terrimesophilobacter sp.]|nr:hypothetical protein [Terrimesophilobacter sp.]
MRQTPLLILAYNRPDKVRNLIERLRPLSPHQIMVAVDGPKPGNEVDAKNVAAVQAAIGEIDWTDNIAVRFRPSNLGLRAAVVDAVSWAICKHGQAVVMEEDVLPGPDFLPYAEHMLDHYRTEERIAHISGYNVVPPTVLSNTNESSRLTIYPESIAWATWDRAWKFYDDDLTWAMNCDTSELASVTGSTASALRWKLNFADAKAGRISTWAYRWIASMWSQRSLTLSPNVNLVTYAGRDEGTHTTMKSPWDELPLFEGKRGVILDPTAHLDEAADDWVNRTVFGGTASGVTKGAAISAALAARKAWRQLRSGRRL